MSDPGRRRPDAPLEEPRYTPSRIAARVNRVAGRNCRREITLWGLIVFFFFNFTLEEESASFCTTRILEGDLYLLLWCTDFLNRRVYELFGSYLLHFE